MRIDNLLLITGNPGKAEEFEYLINLDKLHFSHKKIDLPEIQSAEIEEIGRYKTEMALSHFSGVAPYDAVLTDDTGLYCKALNGLPGPFIKWFLDKLGAEGIYELVDGKVTDTRAVCLLTLGIIKTGEIVQFLGEVDGHLVSPRGGGGFGWDIAFLPNGHQKTYGEMTDHQKNQISHRTLAVQKMREWLLS